MYWQIYSVLLLCVTSSFAMNQEVNATEELSIEQIFHTYCKPFRNYNSVIVPITFCVDRMKNVKIEKIQAIYEKLLKFDELEYITLNILTLIEKGLYPTIPKKFVEDYNNIIYEIVKCDEELTGKINKSQFTVIADKFLDQKSKNIVLSYFENGVFSYEEYILKTRKIYNLENENTIINSHNIKQRFKHIFFNKD